MHLHQPRSNVSEPLFAVGYPAGNGMATTAPYNSTLSRSSAASAFHGAPAGSAPVGASAGGGTGGSSQYAPLTISPSASASHSAAAGTSSNNTQSSLAPWSSSGFASTFGGFAAVSPSAAGGLQARYRPQDLTAYEREEIKPYEAAGAVYYVGNLKSKVISTGGPPVFDDADQHYILRPGDHLNYRYEINEVLGRGSFGQVVKCYDHKTQTYCAVKVCKSRSAEAEATMKELKQLQSVTQGLQAQNHPFANRVVRLAAEPFTFRGHLCIVLELLYLNLYKFLKLNRYSLPMNLTRHIVREIFECLVAIHDQNVIHCDLKPENLVLTIETKPSSTFKIADLHLKIVDFGSAREDLTSEKQVWYVQSRFYRAPEMILDLPYGKPIDIFSVGCIIPELLFGRPLFPGESETQQLYYFMELLGPPPPSFLNPSRRRSQILDSNGRLKPYTPPATAPGSASATKPTRIIRGPGERTWAEIFSSLLGSNASPAQRNDVELLIDLLSKLVTWLPEQRLTARQALEHPWFHTSKSGTTVPPPPQALATGAASAVTNSSTSSNAAHFSGTQLRASQQESMSSSSAMLTTNNYPHVSPSGLDNVPRSAVLQPPHSHSHFTHTTTHAQREYPMATSFPASSGTTLAKGSPTGLPFSSQHSLTRSSGIETSADLLQTQSLLSGLHLQNGLNNGSTATYNQQRQSQVQLRPTASTLPPQSSQMYARASYPNPSYPAVSPSSVASSVTSTEGQTTNGPYSASSASSIPNPSFPTSAIQGRRAQPQMPQTTNLFLQPSTGSRPSTLMSLPSTGISSVTAGRPFTAANVGLSSGPRELDPSVAASTSPNATNFVSTGIVFHRPIDVQAGRSPQANSTESQIGPFTRGSRNSASMVNPSHPQPHSGLPPAPVYAVGQAALPASRQAVFASHGPAPSQISPHQVPTMASHPFHTYHHHQQQQQQQQSHQQDSGLAIAMPGSRVMGRASSAQLIGRTTVLPSQPFM